MADCVFQRRAQDCSQCVIEDVNSRTRWREVEDAGAWLKSLHREVSLGGGPTRCIVVESHKEMAGECVPRQRTAHMHGGERSQKSAMRRSITWPSAS